MFKVSTLLECLGVGLIIIVIASLMLLLIVGSISKEVDRYETEAEIVHIDFAYAQYSPRYTMAVANDEVATTISITPEQYAKYKEGDIVTIEVITLKDIFGDVRNRYKLIEKTP